MTHTDEVLDRAAGAYIANAVGDALGAPYEFGCRRLAEGSAPQMLGGGLGNYRPREWTDDTQMLTHLAIVAATGNPLLSPASLNALSVAFWEWARYEATDIGTTTYAALSAPEPLTGDEQLARAYRVYNETGREGNGGIMRTAPVGVKTWNIDPEVRARTAATVSALTHAGPESVTACVIWSHAIARAVETGTFVGFEEGVKFAARLTPNQDWSSDVASAETVHPSDILNNPLAKGAMLTAWSAISSTMPDNAHYGSLDAEQHITDALYAAVHAGQDTDTVAAIAGGLLGAVYGETAIPTEWVHAIKGLPDDRTAADLRALAHAAASR